MFEARQQAISRLLINAVYQIPRNQRKYVWKKENWSDLWQDILFADENEREHFLGSIVLMLEGKINNLERYTIIDGQQRMTTITLIILVIAFKLKQLRADDDFRGTRQYIIATDSKNASHNILDVESHSFVKEFSREVLGLANDNAPHVKSVKALMQAKIKQEQSDKPLLDCCAYFYEQLDELICNVANPIEKLTGIRDTLFNMSYVHIVATTEEDSYTIFEILNARGQILKDHELLKNYIMRYILPENTRDEVKIQWDDMTSLLGDHMDSFLKHYTMHRHKVSDEEWKAPFNSLRKKTGISNVRELLDDMIIKSQYYRKITHPTTKADSHVQKCCSQEEYVVFKFLKGARHQQFRPIFLSLMHHRELGNISEPRYNKALAFLRDFFVCYKLIGKQESNRIYDVVRAYASQLECNYSEKILVVFFNALRARLPEKEMFVRAFKNLGWSHTGGVHQEHKEKEKVKIALQIIEMHLAGAFDEQDLTIEHILPDSIGRESANIGNLLPLESGLNEDCDNMLYEEKKRIYEQSKYTMTRGFVKRYSSFTSIDADSRADYLAKLIYDEILVFAKPNEKTSL